MPHSSWSCFDLYRNNTISTWYLSNEWFSRKLGKEMYCTDDADVTTIGDGTKRGGEMSPKNLLTTTMNCEWVLIFREGYWNEFKDRGAILPAVILLIGLLV
jgi:hypothetical protein